MTAKKKTTKAPRKDFTIKASRRISKKVAKKPIKSTVKKAEQKKKVDKQKKTDNRVQASDIRVIKTAKTPAQLRGMKDILPKDSKYWKKMYHTAEAITDAYHYEKIETPIVEEASLFVRSIGKGTDVVDKEMYIFEDRDGSKLSLRPEATASVMRAYINHGMHSLTQPIKAWYWGPMFRHDRPQAGRYRQFRQFGCEVIGEHDPVVDAELIALAYNFVRDLGIDTNVHINSIGTLDERQNYAIELVGYLRSKRSYLCDDCKRRINKNPMRVLDCKHEQCQPALEEAPQIIDWLGDPSKNFFMKVLEYLDEMEIPYVLQSTLVRGLDYYSDTVFELYPDMEDQKSQNALGGGGRYNSLSEQIGGRETPASGFSIGLERVLLTMRKIEEAEEKKLVEDENPDIYFAQLGELARMKALKIIEDLRRQGIIVGHNLAKTSLKAQLEIANKMEVKHSLILGQKEVQDGTIIVRDMDSGIQEIIDLKKLTQRINAIINK